MAKPNMTLQALQAAQTWRDSDIKPWRLAEELAVDDAAILCAGGNPSWYRYEYWKDVHVSSQSKRVSRHSNAPPDEPYQESPIVPGDKAPLDKVKRNPDPSSKHFPPYFEAIKQAILSGGLRANIWFAGQKTAVRNASFDEACEEIGQRGLPLSDSDNFGLDWQKTTVNRELLIEWLRRRNMFPEHFFPERAVADFEDKNHLRYSAKLASAIAAWRAIDSPALNKSVKQTIEAWVREHAKEFGLPFDKEGNPNPTAVEDVAKVVNWVPSGGAPTTGSGPQKKAKG